jgi:hypothetical protein
MKTMFKTTTFFALIIFSCTANAQSNIEIGLTGGFARFYPETKFFSQSLNNQADNGFGWSAGLFVEKRWNSWFNPVFEVNYTNLSADFYLENTYYDRETGEFTGRASEAFKGVSFSYLSASAGFKFYLNKKLFVYPGFEFARPLNRKTDLWSVMYYAKEWPSYVYVKNRYLNKTNYYAKLGIGVDLKAVDVILEYVYGLNYQLSFFEYSSPFGINHRNKYLQLKVQIPLYKFR